jgi:hypothetical protein
MKGISSFIVFWTVAKIQIQLKKFYHELKANV